MAVLAFTAVLCASCRTGSKTLWSIGKPDGTPNEFALAPDGFKDYLEADFGYEDRVYVIGHSRPDNDSPYALAGITDYWGGSAPMAGWRPNFINILFTLDKQPADDEDFALNIALADYASRFKPLLKVTINEKDNYTQLQRGEADLTGQPPHSQGLDLTDTLSLAGDLSNAFPETLEIALKGSDLRQGGNLVTLTIIEGSWVLFDAISLTGPSSYRVIRPGNAFIREVKAADYQLDDKTQALIVDAESLKGSPELTVKLDGEPLMKKKLEQGRYVLEVPMPAVETATESRYEVMEGARKLASGTVIRSPRRLQTYADYVDTRLGSSHSRWMIAPGPWMPFGMVKLSPDNQNIGWQAGYQPNFENVGCFSHIHEWTLSGIGIMPANGPLKVSVGDETRPDEGYRSRIDKRSEKAGIGSYSVHLTDYDIEAEMSATTRCGFFRFTFPTDRGDGRILVDLHPQAEYDFKIADAEFRQVGERRIEGYCHQLSPGVWSHDADQDYKVNFVLEFDRDIKSVGSWTGPDVAVNVRGQHWGNCTEAGLFVTFDSSEPMVQMRSGISLVSIANASENLASEVTGPFGWDYEAVVRNQKDVWNDIFSRIAVKTDNRMEKERFYNHMYRSVCSRNIWSDVNGQWLSTDGKIRTVKDPANDVMLGCDAFWNTFWNLNQFWNLVVPEWSGKWVRSQLAMYDANGWLAKGPAGLNYIPVMVAEHEIPLCVSAYQMGIRDFDTGKLLEAAVKMQTTPGGKVFKGFAGNRDLATYMEHHYVPYDQGRFSNTMEYSYDDWTVGQLAKALGNEAIYERFNDRGYWWKNAISEDGYCHLRDSNGQWMEPFDPYRSGANEEYVEGNSWQLTFFVPQDIPALVDKIGAERFRERLLSGFERDEPFRYNAPGEQYWDHPVVQGNQQSMHFSLMFNYALQPWQTQRWSRSILDRYYGYGLGNAYLGDEDQGQMSAWAVMIALGLFQMDGGCGVDPVYEIASPMFEEVTIDLGGRYGRGDNFVITAHGASRRNIYVQSARLNGKIWNSFKFPASELLKGGTLDLEMGPEPNQTWGLE
jgi:predicted alpha-1,2-mannosidase